MDHQALWPQMVSALAAIDAELGMPEDGCNSTQRTLDAIRLLKAVHADDQKEIERLKSLLAEERRLYQHSVTEDKQ